MLKTLKVATPLHQQNHTKNKDLESWTPCINIIATSILSKHDIHDYIHMTTYSNKIHC
jgi:hypothetical protein